MKVAEDECQRPTQQARGNGTDGSRNGADTEWEVTERELCNKKKIKLALRSKLNNFILSTRNG